MKEHYQMLKIEHRFSFAFHPQTSGQVELNNKILYNRLKSKIKGAKGEWVELLDEILWYIERLRKLWNTFSLDLWYRSNDSNWNRML